MQYEEFRNEGIKIIAGFDNCPGKRIKNIGRTHLPYKEMKEFVKKNNTRVGIIAVPDSEAAATLDMMIESGIRGILNFASIELRINNSGDSTLKSRRVQSTTSTSALSSNTSSIRLT